MRLMHLVLLQHLMPLMRLKVLMRRVRALREQELEALKRKMQARDAKNAEYGASRAVQASSLPRTLIV